jgi:hypothetical protein
MRWRARRASQGPLGRRAHQRTRYALRDAHANRRLQPLRYLHDCSGLSDAESVSVVARSRWRRLITCPADSSSSVCWSRLSLRVEPPVAKITSGASATNSAANLRWP